MEIVNNQQQELLIRAFAYLDGFEFFVGTFLNIILFCVILQPNLRRIPNFVLTRYFIVSNTLIFTFHSLPNFIGYLYQIDFRSTNLIWCKILYYLDVVFLHWSAWLLVSTNLLCITFSIILMELFLI